MFSGTRHREVQPPMKIAGTLWVWGRKSAPAFYSCYLSLTKVTPILFGDFVRIFSTKHAAPARVPGVPKAISRAHRIMFAIVA